MARVAAAQIDRTERKYLGSLIRSLPSDTPVVLVGSWARGTVIPDLSDIDVLVIGEHPTPTPPAEIQIILIPEGRFRERLRGGDDFPQWALRFGVPLSGRKRWRELSESLLQDAPWPSVERKLEQADRKLSAVRDLLEMGDIPAAEEELRFALSHIARALLLSRQVFPLSRPELAEQLAQADLSSVARYLRRLNAPKPLTRTEIALLAGAARRWANRLSPATGEPAGKG